MSKNPLRLDADEMKRILPGVFQCLYEKPGEKVVLTTELSIYDMAIATWGKDTRRVTLFYRGHILPPTPADLSEAAGILYREIQRIDHDLTPQP